MKIIHEIWGWVKDNWVPILVTSLLIPILFYVIPYFWDNYFFVATISPAKKKIFCGSDSFRKESYYVYLTNNSSKPIYNINVWAIYPKGIEVNIHPEGREPEWQSSGNLKLDSTAIQITFIPDRNKNTTGTQTVINNLGAKETIKLKVEIEKTTYYKTFNLKLKTKFNSRSPEPILSTR